MKVIFYPAISLDGYIAEAGGGSDWVDEQDDALYRKEIEKAGCCIVGRVTYDQYKEDFEEDGRVTFVCTTHPEDDTDKVVFVNAEPAKVLEEIEKRGFSSTVLSGGGDTNGRFAEAGLIDEIIISIYPFTLGEGIRLFGDYNIDIKLELLSSKPVVNGIIQNHYKVIR